MNITIGKSRFEEFKTKLAKLNAKLTKAGYAPVEYTVLGDKYTELMCGNRKAWVSWTELEITSPIEAYQLDGYTYIGSIKTVNGVSTIIGNDPKLQTLTDVTRCDHCNVNRNRNLIHVFNHEGKLYVVGSTCVDDYLGYNVADHLSSWSDFITSWQSEVEDTESYGYGGVWYPHFDTIVNYAQYFIVKHNGYRKSTDDAWSTANYIDWFESPAKITPEVTAEINAYNEWATESNIKLVDAIVKYWETYECKTNFECNVRARIVGRDARSTALIAWGVFKYYQANGLLIASAPKDIKKSIGFVGEVGTKLTLKVKLVGLHSFDTQFGTSYINILETESGQQLKWKSANMVDIDNAWFEAQFKVKGQDVFNGNDQTVISHLKVLAVV